MCCLTTLCLTSGKLKVGMKNMGVVQKLEMQVRISVFEFVRQSVNKIILFTLCFNFQFLWMKKVI